MIRQFLYFGLWFSLIFSQQYKIDHMEGTFDLDGDGFMEFASLESKINGDKKLSVVRYYELDDNGYQTLEWELESPDGLLSNFVDVELGDLDGDGIWSGSYSFDNANGQLEYKYCYDNWVGQEDLIDDMQNYRLQKACCIGLEFG